MLKYLVETTESMIVAAVLIGLIYAFIGVRYKGKGPKLILTIGFLAGMVGAVVIAILRRTTKLIDKAGGAGAMNNRIFTVSLIALGALAVLMIICGIKIVKKYCGKIEKIVIPAVAAVLVGTLVIYVMPGIFITPFTFSLNGESILSAAFFTRFTGYIAAILLSVLTALAAYHSGKRLGQIPLGAILGAGLVINAVQQFSKIAQVLYARRTIKGRGWFNFVRFTSNQSDLFIYLILAVTVLIPLILWFMSFVAKEPYSNSAERRKIRAKWRSIRRWSTVLVLCFGVVTLNLTVFRAMANKVIELSPIEECEDRGDSLYIPFTQVEDGHLHRFAYTTKDNIQTRFIVIKKPNSSAYGIGLDACDICGETGYYERNGQIVCKLCDVVMNINTIGFKGGCNPIVIDYSIENNYIIVPKATLEEHQNEFK